MDTKLLLDIFRIPSPSGYEQGTQEYIKTFLESYNIDFTEDEYGNIFNISNMGAPVLSAHMDTVQRGEDVKLTNLIRIRRGILSGYGVIGGDDKCGIYLALEILKKNKLLNFIFTVQEEAGCVGISYFMNRNDITHIPYGLVLDRYGSSDIICSDNDYGTKEFEDALAETGVKFGYKPAMGILSDGDYISEQISCANISVGYYNHHTKNELVVLEDLENAYHYLSAVVVELSGHKFSAPKKHYYRSTSKDKSFFDDEVYGKNGSYYDHDFDPAIFACAFCGDYDDKMSYLDSLERYVCNECAKKFIDDIQNNGLIDELMREHYTRQESFDDDFDITEEEDFNEVLERELDDFIEENNKSLRKANG